MQSRTRGDKTAFADGRREVTYGELDQRSARVAGHLAGIGLKAGDRAAIVQNNGVSAVESYYAINRAGAIGVPVNPQSSDAEVAHILDDCGARLVIADAPHLDQLTRLCADRPDLTMVLAGDVAAVSGPVPSFDEMAATDPGESARDSLGLDDDAWILYTSGTTGRPKGVVSTQGNCLWSVAACYAPIFGLSADDRVLWPLPLFHSLAHVLCVHGVLATGATARILPAFAVQELLDVMRDEACTFLVGVPATYHYLIKAADGPRDRGEFAAVRMGLVTGAAASALPFELVQDILGAPLLDSYGSTETSGAITVNWPSAERVPGSCGLPVPGLSVRLVDPSTGLEVPAGAEGEVWVSGPNVMRGYHDQPAETRQVLRDGWYHTGDLARLDPNGYLTIVGRIKELIIRGGENIHPVEIEDVLRAGRGVADAAVAGMPEPVLGEVPVGYLVAEPGAELDPAGLLEACRQRLALFKVPAELRQVEQLPRTGSGKVQRRLLADQPARLLIRADELAGAVAESMPGARAVVRVPTAGREKFLLNLVRAETAATLSAAGPSAIDPRRSFRDLGLNSLKAVELGNRLSAVTGLTLPSAVVFDRPTPAVLAQHLDTLLSGRPDNPVAAYGRRGPADEDPVVIVGMSCRYPGDVRTPEDLWELVAAGRDAIGEFPRDRGWDLQGLYHPDANHPGTSYVRSGGFLYDAAEFDSDLFDISPREALAIDPQQRSMLELSWEAFERAGIDPLSLHGSRTGVFTGVMFHDYGTGHSAVPSDVQGYVGIGSAGSVVSGRIAYAFGLEGPAISVDTACSSSLVALHVAAQALRQDECELALAGGIAMMATPGVFVEFSRQRGLAPDGRCKSFATAADGTAWSEGAGLLLLERLSDARRNQHRVLAVVRGSAINQDGASNGLTAPSGPAQERVIAQALANARLSADEVDAVEAHGTGTALGDPIEARALLATYGRDRAPGHPLLLGTIKSNIGHPQAAAGVAGVIKMIMAMQHGVLPATLHVDEPTPDVDWSSNTVRLLTEQLRWPRRGRPWRAGVSSFGVSGTNAHIILEQPADGEDPAAADEPESPGRCVPWVLSGKGEQALRAQAGRLREFLGSAAGADPESIGCSLVTSRATLSHRAVVLGVDGATLLAGLDAISSGKPMAGVIKGRPEGVAVAENGIVFVFPGQGSQWSGMASELLAASEVFAAQVRVCATALSPHVDWQLEDVLRGLPGAPPLERVDVVQPALWAMMVSLAAVWRSFGVEPTAVVGHSQGEIAAACVAGSLTINDGARVVARRSRILASLAGRGGMLSVAVPEADFERFDGPGRESGWGSRVEVAAVNGPSSIVVSGDPAALDELVSDCERAGIRTRRIPVNYASHSAHVEEIRDDIMAELAPITPVASEIPFFSATDGQWLEGTSLDAAYWYRNLRRPVRFEEAICALAGEGHTTFIEVSSHPVVTMGIRETIEATGVEAAIVGSLRRDDGGLPRFFSSLAEAHVLGVPVDWTAAFPARPRPSQLPTYAFQHRRYWLEAPAARGGVNDPGGPGQASHPLLGNAVDLAEGDSLVLTGQVSAVSHPWLADHVVLGTAIMPGTAFLDMAIHAADRLGCPGVEELTLQAPLSLPAEGSVRLQLIAGPPDEEGRRPVTVHSRPDDVPPGSPWTLHGKGMLAGKAGLWRAAAPGPCRPT